MSLPRPWQRPVWDQLWSVRQAQRLPQALLLSAAPGSGLSEFGLDLSRALLCMAGKADGSACERCQSCRLFAAGSHPDFVSIMPEDGSTAIKIDQVRTLRDLVGLAGQYSDRRIAVLDPADRLTLNAANSLLKTLEEPPLGCVLILLTAKPMSLPITIRSRCQHYRFPRRVDATTLAWLRAQVPDSDPEQLLALAANAPLAALALAGGAELALRDRLLGELEALRKRQADPIVIAGGWSVLEFGVVSRWLIALIEDLIRLHLHPEAATVSNRDQRARLQNLAATLPLPKLFAARELLLQDQKLLAAISGLTTLSLYEEFTLAWGNQAAFR